MKASDVKGDKMDEKDTKLLAKIREMNKKLYKDYEIADEEPED
jgi:hypothetical protein